MVAIAVFALLPAQLEVNNFRVPILSGLAGLTLAAVGRITLTLIQRQTSKETVKALNTPLSRLDGAVDKIEQIHFFHEQGVEGIFSDRTRAMPRFLDEFEREENWIGIVGTSLLGALDPSNRDDEKEKLMQLLERKRRENVRIDSLLMHPAYGEFRERVENRSRAAVAKDIQASLAKLIKEENGSKDNDNDLFGLNNIKLYPSVITAFAMFTKRALLINTSTLTGPVYDNVTLIVSDTDDPNSIYKKFKSSHFNEPWQSEKTIPITKELLTELVGINFADDKYRFSEGGWPSTIVDEKTPAQYNENNMADSGELAKH